MKRIFSLIMALCLLFCGVLPVMAMENPASAAVIGESGGAPEGEAPGISPFSDFGDGDTTFTAKIRLTVTDRDGNPIAGAVYGLYSSDGTLIQELVTDSYGIATSDDVPVNSNYYVEEITAPEGFQPNDGRQEIILTEVCAPSRIDITAEYDPITGQIQVIKTDEDGNLLEGVGFYVYTYPDWTQADDITTGADGTATTITLPYGEYAFSEYNTPDGLTADSYYYATISEQDVTVELEITNYKAMGDMKITKTGNDGRKIAGAVFEIRKADTDALVEEITTGSEGTVWSAYMPLGDYYAVEKSVPAPYKLDTTHHEFSLTYHYQSVYLNIENMVDGDPGRVKIIKTDESDNPLEGVVFGLYRSWDAKKLAELTTGADGTAESGDLIPGDYYLLEQTGKPGFTPVTGQIAFTIDGTGVTVEQTVVNPKIRIFGKVQVIKVDDAENPIPGVKFGVYCDQGNLLEELSTGEDGTIISSVLNEGDYYLAELEGADGYVMDAEQHPFSIVTNESVVSVTVTNPRITGSVQVTKTGNGTEPLPGVKFGIYRADDTPVETLITGEDGTAQSGTLYYGEYYLKELETVDGYELIDAPIPFSILTQDVVLEIPVSNPLILGGVSLTKTNEDGLPLPGAVFSLYNGAGQKLAELTTDADGLASYTGLPKGEYYLRELRAPEGYISADRLLPFEIAAQGKLAELSMTNTAGFGVIEVQKFGEDGALSGVSFDVYRTSTDEKVGNLVTDAEGTAALELPLGRYYLVETATAPGFTLLTGKASFTLTADGETVELPIMNQKESCKPEGGHIRLLKRDVDNSDTLTGAIFGIYHSGTAKYAGEIATGSDGTATSLMLPAGDYYIVELRAPDGYETDATQHPVTVTTGGIVEITVSNKKLPETPTEPDPDTKIGTVKIIKTDTADGNKKLSGASFSVYETADGKKVGELLTGKDGTAALELPEGDYTIRETAAPEGYVLSTEAISLHLKAGGTQELTVKNSKTEPGTPEQPAKPGILRIVKLDRDSGKKLAGAVFGVYNADTDRQIDTLTTDKNGAAELSLPAGDYYIREQEAPKGYILKKTDINFHLESGATRELTVKNTREDEPKKMGILELTKEDAETGKPLRGAVFAVYDKEDERIDELTTDRDGIAELELPVGSYYLREVDAPKGYKLDRSKVTFKISEDKTTRITVENDKEKSDPVKPETPKPETPKPETPKPEQPKPTTPSQPQSSKPAPSKPGVTGASGRIELVKLAAGSGSALPGAVFGVYDEKGGKLNELTTGADGTATLSLSVGRYYLKEQRAPHGYKPETARIRVDLLQNKTTIVEVTNEIDPDAPPLPEIHVPQTGIPFPVQSYALAVLLFGIASLCGVMLFRSKKRTH